MLPSTAPRQTIGSLPRRANATALTKRAVRFSSGTKRIMSISFALLAASSWPSPAKRALYTPGATGVLEYMNVVELDAYTQDSLYLEKLINGDLM